MISVLQIFIYHLKAAGRKNAAFLYVLQSAKKDKKCLSAGFLNEHELIGFSYNKYCRNAILEHTYDVIHIRNVRERRKINDRICSLKR